MTSLSLWNWLKPLQRQAKVDRRRSRRHDRTPRARIVPRLEVLEDRLTPTTFTPTVFTDNLTGGTLREAVINANSDTGTATDTIQLSAGTYTLSIANIANNHDVSSTQGDLNITSTAHALIIQGATDANGNPTSIIDQTAVDRVIQILNLDGGSAATVTFKNLIIEGGNAQDDGSAGAKAGLSDARGGGILNDGGNVTLSNVVVRSNQATAGAALSAQGGGIYAQDGALTISNSVIQKNTATAGLGGADSFGGGVSIVSTGASTIQLSVTNSTVASNTAQGGDSAGGGVYSAADKTILTASTLSSNVTDGGATGEGFGGGAALYGSNTIVNSTIAANVAKGASQEAAASTSRREPPASSPTTR